ncbi:MAG: UDP-N-acetylmuramoyl-tripeptide--D-alanyl-D-alanine ligase [Chloroflexi bacterium]|nr:UDP-N-acetylmuramoyl-tripeptide--D-alanyl-D-alanine ligase [Chloroflexota bacterium]
MTEGRRLSSILPTDWSGADLVAWTAGRAVRLGSRRIRGAAVDSRLVTRDGLFVALPGERTDGHRFLAAALEAGASAIVATDAAAADTVVTLATSLDASIILVADGGEALRAAAAHRRAAWHGLAVGITGSLAKTSTKEQVADVLAEQGPTLRTGGNRNNEIGLPLTLLELDPAHHAAVLEMGLYVPGDIALLCGIARPSIGVVTAVRGVHLSRAGSLDSIVAGKRELVEALPVDGTAVLNIDDPLVAGMAGHTSARVLGYGFGAAADVTASAVESLGAAGMRYVLRLPDGSETPMVTPALGRHSVHNGLAAAAVGFAAGMTPTAIARGLGRGSLAPHRTTLLETERWRVLDDSYNAAPDSMRAALELLATLPGRHIAVLGEMFELGDATTAAQAHREVGAAARATADLVVVVGEGAAGIAEGAIAAGMDRARVRLVADRDAARGLLLAMADAGDTILVKASRGAELDRLVADLVAAGGPPVGTRPS